MKTLARRNIWFPLLVVGTIFIVMFGSVLLGDRMFGFRDAAHFYWPVYRYIHDQLASGRIPLWNPQENLGTPMLASGTAGVFYPMKLIFWLPISYTACYKLFVTGHLLLAAAGAYRLSRYIMTPQPKQLVTPPDPEQSGHTASSVASSAVVNRAATLAAIVYAFGAPVLYQYCNVVFLIGAAWLPWAVLEIDRLLTRRRPTDSLRAAIPLTMMVLGGDPQTAYHTVLITGLLWAMRLRAERKQRKADTLSSRASQPNTSLQGTDALASSGAGERQSTEQITTADPPKNPTDRNRRALKPCEKTSITKADREPCEPGVTRPVRLRIPRWALLGMMCVAALLLSAVQVLPSYEFSRTSQRTLYDEPRTLYEYASAEPDSRSTDGLLCRSPNRWSHLRSVYEFSVEPWQLTELFWPNVGGQQFPRNARWFHITGIRGRTWVPSLYLGIIPILLALSVMRYRTRDPRDVIRCWITWCVILSILAALGGFGLVWLLQVIRFGLTGTEPSPDQIGGPVGGLYWIMTHLLPGYINFRYPAKWMTVASLGIAMLSGWSIVALFASTTSDRLPGASPSGVYRHRLRHFCRLLIGLSLLMVLVLLIIYPYWSGWVKDETSSFFGPLDATSSFRDMLWAFWQTAVVVGLLGWLIDPLGKGRQRLSLLDRREHPARVTSLIVILAAVDLMIANRWMIATVPQKLFDTPIESAQTLLDEMSEGRLSQTVTETNGPAPLRIFRHPIWYPRSWRETGSDSRIATSVNWDRNTLWPKYTLNTPIGVSEVHGTMMSRDYFALLRSSRAADPYPGRDLLDLMNVTHAVLPDSIRLDNAEPIISIQTGQGRAETPAIPDTHETAETSGASTTPRDGANVWRLHDPMPRCWIVRDVQIAHGTDDAGDNGSNRWDAAMQQCHDVLWPDDRPIDLRRFAVVEDPGPETREMIQRINGMTPDQEAVDSCQIIEYEPERVEIRATLHSPGLLVLAEQYANGWTVEIADESLPDSTTGTAATIATSTHQSPIVRTNRVMRGITLPAGTHRLTFRYRPKSFTAGLWISALAWLALIATFCVAGRFRR